MIRTRASVKSVERARCNPRRSSDDDKRTPISSYLRYILIITRVIITVRDGHFSCTTIRLRAIGARSGAVHAKMELTAAIPYCTRNTHTHTHSARARAEGEGKKERRRGYKCTRCWHGREVKRALSQDRA